MMKQIITRYLPAEFSMEKNSSQYNVDETAAWLIHARCTNLQDSYLLSYPIYQPYMQGKKFEIIVTTQVWQIGLELDISTTCTYHLQR